MRPSHRMLLLVALAVLVSGYFLLPKKEERAAMLARDGLYDAALREVAAMANGDANRPQILMQLHVLRERNGDRAGSLAALEAYVAARPDDFQARTRYSRLHGPPPTGPPRASTSRR